MIAVIRLVLAKERLAKLFCHKNAFVGQAENEREFDRELNTGNEREFDQELNTGFASALVSPSNNNTLKEPQTNHPKKIVTIVL